MHADRDRCCSLTDSIYRSLPNVHLIAVNHYGITKLGNGRCFTAQQLPVRETKPSHAGSDPQESDLLSWALQKGVLPVLAQASLCMNQVYAPCSRRRVLFVPGLPIVQQGS